MTELSFLLDLLLNHKLAPATKQLVSERLKEVERRLNDVGVTHEIKKVDAQIQTLSPQAPSTIAAMLRHANEAPATVEVPLIPANVGQTPAAVAALESRNRAIAESIAGAVNKATGRPRKF